MRPSTRTRGPSAEARSWAPSGTRPSARREHEPLGAVDVEIESIWTQPSRSMRRHELGPASRCADALRSAGVATTWRRAASRAISRTLARLLRARATRARSARSARRSACCRRRRARPGSTAGRGRRRRAARMDSTTGSGAHELARRRLERATRPSRIARSSSVRSSHASEHLAVVDHGQLRDAVALQQRDRVGDRLLRADADERRDVAGARRAHELADGRRARRVVEQCRATSIQSSSKTFERYGAAAVGQDHEHRLVGRQLARRRRARRAAPCRPSRRSGCPRRARPAASQRNASRSETRIQRSTIVAVERRRPEVLADALDEIRVHGSLDVDRALGSAPTICDPGLALLEVAPRRPSRCRPCRRPRRARRARRRAAPRSRGPSSRSAPAGCAGLAYWFGLKAPASPRRGARDTE